ncbi:hypothetical protein BH10ACI3_BH10ACI3_23970 [soil metagenome]
MSCNELFKAGTATKAVHFERFAELHNDGKDLIRSWYYRALETRDDNAGDKFESFIFGWFAFNGWMSCVVDTDIDAVCIKSIGKSADMNEIASNLLNNQESQTSVAARQLLDWAPVFDVKSLRRSGIHISFAHYDDRTEMVNEYLQMGATEFEPKCWIRHIAANESIPSDLPHVLNTIYKIRCNLFHGQKAAHSEMDQEIVRRAYYALMSFIDEAHLLN